MYIAYLTREKAKKVNKEQHKCLIDVIERDCVCSSFLFPRNRNATEQLKPCGFIQQVIFNTDHLEGGSRLELQAVISYLNDMF